MKARPSRAFLAMGAGVCALLLASAQAEDKVTPNETQLPQQVLPTGAEDAAQPAARSVANAAESQQAIEQLVEMTSESSEGLVVETLPDGSKMVDLQGRFMSVAVQKKTPDGNVEVGCFTGEEAVAHAKHAHEAAAAAKDAKRAPAKASSMALEEE
jgi:hypothetical protein